MNARDYTDPSLISPDDPASRDYQRPERCSLCRGDCVIPCEDCEGTGAFEDGNECDLCRGDGVRECPNCDGVGAEP